MELLKSHNLIGKYSEIELPCFLICEALNHRFHEGRGGGRDILKGLECYLQASVGLLPIANL